MAGGEGPLRSEADLDHALSCNQARRIETDSSGWLSTNSETFLTEDSRIDIARIEGQVKVSSVKKVSEFVETHPEESVSILRAWLHESA